MSDWISIKEKQPKNYERVRLRVLYFTGEIKTIEGLYVETKKNDELTQDGLGAVTHWMPLSDMPEGEE